MTSSACATSTAATGWKAARPWPNATTARSRSSPGRTPARMSRRWPNSRSRKPHDPEKWEPVFGKDHAAKERIMKILVATDAWHPQINGVVRTLGHVARAARALGADVEFLAPSEFWTLP